MDYKQVIANKINAKLNDREIRSRIANWGAKEMIDALKPIAERRADMRYVPKHIVGVYAGEIRGWSFKTKIDGVDVSLWVYLTKDYNNRPKLDFCYETSLKQSPREISSPYIHLDTEGGVRIAWKDVANDIQKWLDTVGVQSYSKEQREKTFKCAIAFYEAYKAWDSLEDNLDYTLDVKEVRYWGME